MNWKETLGICFGIFVAGMLAVLLIFNTEPDAERSGATKQTAMLVEVTEPERGDFAPQIVATGVVRPAREIMLQSRVSGEIIDRTPGFDPGGFVEKGDVLLRIDPADYEIAIQQQESAVQQAESNLKIEMGLQEVAQKEYQLLGDTLADDNKALLLRKPQLAQARSQVESARADLKQAKLDLNRTALKAPFNAQVLNRYVDLGSQVSAGQDLGRLIGLDNFWIQASLPVSKLRWLTFSEENANNASVVEITDRSSAGVGISRTGTLYRLIGSLEQDTRLARVLVNVQDPLALRSDDPESLRLIIGSFVQVVINGRILKDVIRLDRKLLREGDTVWVMKDGELSIRKVYVVFEDAAYAYISEGLTENSMVVSTNLSSISEGAALRLDEQGSVSGANKE